MRSCCDHPNGQRRCSADAPPRSHPLHARRPAISARPPAERQLSSTTAAAGSATLDASTALAGGGAGFAEVPRRALTAYRALVLDSAYRPVDVVGWQVRSQPLPPLRRAAPRCPPPPTPPGPQAPAPRLPPPPPPHAAPAARHLHGPAEQGRPAGVLRCGGAQRQRVLLPAG